MCLCSLHCKVIFLKKEVVALQKDLVPCLKENIAISTTTNRVEVFFASIDFSRLFLLLNLLKTGMRLCSGPLRVHFRGCEPGSLPHLHRNPENFPTIQGCANINQVININSWILKEVGENIISTLSQLRHPFL